jgi:hypothetical protein
MCDDSAVTDPEGGQVILEYIYLDTELQAAAGLPPGVTTINRMVAFFEEHQTPEVNPFPMMGQCNNLVATKGWPGYIGSPHTDLDVGTLTVTGKNAAGTDMTLSLDKMPAGMDAFGRPHDVFYQKINPVADNFIKPDSAYAVKFGGSAAAATTPIPATTFDGGLYLAAKFDVSNPGLEDNGPLVAGTNFTVHWTPTSSPGLPTGDVENVITWLVGTDNAATHMCIAPASAGQFTVPGTAIAEYQAIQKAKGLPFSKMILLRNGAVHQLRRLPNGETNNKRRIDLLTLMCWAQLMDVQGTPP